MINMNKVPYFSNPKRLRRLKEFLSVRDDFMVHELAVATGCSFQEALSVCVLLWHFQVAEIYILLSLPDLSDITLYQGKLSDGPPKLPFYNEDYDIQIDNLSDMTYEFQFIMFPNADYNLYV